ncbi:hypothetical protein [Sphingobacterium faecium]|uniref:hypothetical protein n=1 Tax=Sphingobacterium faecium TaxID=34087 RepID=UPI00247A0946|nr:hypothetical protein [Sphingobacterium faecium]WGQ15588.1 hypothetical protein QG727_04070 [Sphingobacterium faecium]
MRKILIIGIGNAAILARALAGSFPLSRATGDRGLNVKELLERFNSLSKEANETSLKFERLASSISALVPIKEKKPKYIRQQHKLAQRHFRRK